MQPFVANVEVHLTDSDNSESEPKPKRSRVTIEDLDEDETTTGDNINRKPTEIGSKQKSILKASSEAPKVGRKPRGVSRKVTVTMSEKDFEVYFENK